MRDLLQGAKPRDHDVMTDAKYQDVRRRRFVKTFFPGSASSPVRKVVVRRTFVFSSVWCSGRDVFARFVQCVIHGMRKATEKATQTAAASNDDDDDSDDEEDRRRVEERREREMKKRLSLLALAIVLPSNCSWRTELKPGICCTTTTTTTKICEITLFPTENRTFL